MSKGKSLPLIRLLGQNISAGQLVGYALAALTGMSILLAGFCFSKDVRPLFSSDKRLFKKEWMVVNKKVPVLSVLRDGPTFFTRSEMKELEEQTFVRSLSYFTPSRFRVNAYIDPSDRMSGLATDMFFESVPDRFIDKQNPQWKWEEGSPFIPVVIPQDYVNLYNFGFAGSQGLPQISEGIIQQVAFRIVLSGNGKQEVFNGKIVDFSTDLNTILVPETFMKWANNRFAAVTDTDNISRLIIDVNNPADPQITTFFSSKPDYVINDNKGEQGKLSYFLHVLIIAVMVAGGLIMLPSIGLMLLSINLIVYKNRTMLSDLMLLGYKRRSLSQPYCILTLLLNLAVGALALCVVHRLRGLYVPKLIVLGLDISANFLSTEVFALIFMLLLSVLDVLWIKRKIGKIEIPGRG